MTGKTTQMLHLRTQGQTSQRATITPGRSHMQHCSHLPLLVVIKILRYQVAALVAASILGGGPWMFNTHAATFTVEPTQCIHID